MKNGPSARVVGDDLTSVARRDQPTVDSEGTSSTKGSRASS
ncbi:MAG TPA: hypothetical protein VF833_00150 [Gaiellaceae bacterium]